MKTTIRKCKTIWKSTKPNKMFAYQEQGKDGESEEQLSQ